jgi:hypothetical protein
MNKVTEKELVSLINSYKPFAAEFENGSFRIQVDEYVPVVATAVHAGARVRAEIKQKILLNQEQRYFEEDPMTDQMISGCPIVLIANDSRYQYDLNRVPENCIYEEAWGKKVWGVSLTEQEKKTSLDAHASYYRVLGALLTALEKRFSRVVLYDLHSYNFKRQGEDSPLFNIGTHFIDISQFTDIIEDLIKRLRAIKIEGVVTRVGIDDVFYGKGYQADFIQQNHPRSLCIPLEVKKVYMDEHSGELYPDIIEQLTQDLHMVIAKNSGLFRAKYCT